eukprot:CAMPEP_0181319886 /NCGR_PEP_ID=MMETSP1101-20121128/17817_1 /TAXON_ID=46948 /ORGANISM="Rhodomonas abbreviata, Strain Caron Lab Isolate" /LENGTH=54 /DNA_ID=CAMNT_0023427529 /DNA_START=30 /DNA_END=194 /DNA_ORIENTATION=-
MFEVLRQQNNASGLHGIRSLVTQMGPPDNFKGVWKPGMFPDESAEKQLHCEGYC